MSHSFNQAEDIPDITKKIEDNRERRVAIREEHEDLLEDLVRLLNQNHLQRFSDLKGVRSAEFQIDSDPESGVLTVRLHAIADLDADAIYSIEQKSKDEGWDLEKTEDKLQPYVDRWSEIRDRVHHEMIDLEEGLDLDLTIYSFVERPRFDEEVE